MEARERVATEKRAAALRSGWSTPGVLSAITENGFKAPDLAEMYERCANLGCGEEKAAVAIQNSALVAFYFSQIPADFWVEEMEFIHAFGAWVNMDTASADLPLNR